MRMKRARDPGKVRIIAGTLRGSKLPVHDVPGLRPTPDRVRETLFNWLMPYLPGARCLDLFAGTGALGIEASSRGAGEVVLVECDPLLADSLRKELARLKVTSAQVFAEPAERFLAGRARRFDIVFLDPPFAAGLWTPIAQQLEQSGWLAEHAMIYIETSAGAEPPLPPTWRRWRQLRAGDVQAELWRRGAGATEGAAGRLS
jgi:16S rRNA (guanine966-N2)-methyltransferase